MGNRRGAAVLLVGTALFAMTRAVMDQMDAAPIQRPAGLILLSAVMLVTSIPQAAGLAPAPADLSRDRT
jgi:hypothetical protein